MHVLCQQFQYSRGNVHIHMSKLKTDAVWYAVQVLGIQAG